MVTLGCRTNQYESQAYLDQLESIGYQQAAEDEIADLCIVNTCTVTQAADLSSRQAVKQLARKHPGAKIVVTGCAAQKDAEGFTKLGSQVISNFDKEQLLPMVFPELEFPEFKIHHFDSHTRAFVKVQDGCNSFCTYCIIPYVRGRSRSRRLIDVVEEVKDLVSNGFQEVVLTGINVGDFDGAPEPGEVSSKLSDLVCAVDKIDGIKRVRISSIDPDEVDDQLMEAILSGKNTCKNLHLVLQSGSNLVLKRMNRKYTVQIFLDTVMKLREKYPEFEFTTDVIVGFPGETEIDFQDTLAILRNVGFMKVHMFPYSRREKTRAALYPNQVDGDTIQKRKRILMEVAEETSFLARQKYVGKTVHVLIENGQNGALFFGHTDHFLPVWVEAVGEIAANQIIEVYLQENRADGLKGIQKCD